MRGVHPHRGGRPNGRHEAWVINTSVTAAGFTPASCRLPSNSPWSFGPSPVSINSTRCPVRTSSAFTLSVIRSVGAPAARNRSPILAVSTPTPNVLPSLGTTNCVSCRDISLILPTLNECAAGGTPLGPKVSAAPAAAESARLTNAVTHTAPRIVCSLVYEMHYRWSRESCHAFTLDEAFSRMLA